MTKEIPPIDLIEITKDKRGNYNVDVWNKESDDIYDRAGFVSPKDALEWIASFIDKMEPLS